MLFSNSIQKSLWRLVSEWLSSCINILDLSLAKASVEREQNKISAQAVFFFGTFFDQFFMFTSAVFEKSRALVLCVIHISTGYARARVFI